MASLSLSLCSKLLFKEKEKKLESQTGKSGFMKAEKMCGFKVNAVLDGKKRTHRSQSRQPSLMFPLIARLLTSGHEYICFHHLWLCAYTWALQATVYKQSLSPVTGHRSYSGLLFRCTPSECPVSMWKSASQGQRVTFLQLFGILPQGSSSVEACACACVCAVCVHELFVFHAANCILLEERHCMRVLRW